MEEQQPIDLLKLGQILGDLSSSVKNLTKSVESQDSHIKELSETFKKATEKMVSIEKHEEALTRIKILEDFIQPQIDAKKHNQKKSRRFKEILNESALGITVVLGIITLCGWTMTHILKYHVTFISN